MDRNRCVNNMTEHKFIGQARKSLWIETGRPRQRPARLSGQARKSLWIETISYPQPKLRVMVRLVRACGSKQSRAKLSIAKVKGQARKSLWIETPNRITWPLLPPGQARKSLWIETPSAYSARARRSSVRLVRACGSKPCGSCGGDKK